MTVRAFALLALWITVASSARANLLANGSFETFTSTFAGDGGRQLLAGNTFMTGWTVVAGEIAILHVPNSYSLTASDGTNFLDMIGYSNVLGHGITQTVSGLVVGHTYRFAVDLGLSNIASCVPGATCTGPISVTVQISPGPSQVLTHDSNASGNVWSRYSFDFTATATTVAVTVTATARPANGAYVGVDNLSLDEITPISVLPYEP
ncbi:MAG TPA: DUF642 domain-containing protein [Myxococcota bacterium]|nr:DUF642 domain-containing protein [Myxococcota bacterium]